MNLNIFKKVKYRKDRYGCLLHYFLKNLGWEDICDCDREIPFLHTHNKTREMLINGKEGYIHDPVAICTECGSEMKFEIEVFGAVFWQKLGDIDRPLYNTAATYICTKDESHQGVVYRSAEINNLKKEELTGLKFMEREEI